MRLLLRRSRPTRELRPVRVLQGGTPRNSHTGTQAHRGRGRSRRGTNQQALHWTTLPFLGDAWGLADVEPSTP